MVCGKKFNQFREIMKGEDSADVISNGQLCLTMKQL